MKAIGFLFLFILHNAVSTGQSLTPKEMDFLRQVLPVACLQNRIVYCNGVDTNEIDAMRRSLKEKFKKNIIHTKSSDSDQTFILTSKEKQQTLQYVSGMNKPLSINGLLDSAIVVSSKELTDFFNTYRADAWSKFYEKYDGVSGYYEFSRPIFLRDSLCLFYWAQVCNITCGEGHLTFYRLTNNHWKKWFDIYDWIS